MIQPILLSPWLLLQTRLTWTMLQLERLQRQHHHWMLQWLQEMMVEEELLRAMYTKIITLAYGNMNRHQPTIVLAYSSMRDMNACIVLKAWVRTDLYTLVSMDPDTSFHWSILTFPYQSVPKRWQEQYEKNILGYHMFPQWLHELIWVKLLIIRKWLPYPWAPSRQQCERGGNHLVNHE